jgi:hypothetical protein
VSKTMRLGTLACVMLTAAAGCGDDSGGSAVDGGRSDADAGGIVDAGAPEVEYLGPVAGGGIPQPPVQQPDAYDDVSAEVDTRCCNVTLTLPDPSGDEMSPAVFGDVAPLNAPGGLPLTYVNGAWQASACLPVNVAVEYDFRFTVPYAVSLPDGGSSIEIPDGAQAPMAPSDSEREDAGVAETVDASDDTAAPATMVVRRHNPALPAVSDGLGGQRNVFAPVAECSAIGATTGTVPPAP